MSCIYFFVPLHGLHMYTTISGYSVCDITPSPLGPLNFINTSDGKVRDESDVASPHKIKKGRVFFLSTCAQCVP